MPWHESVPKSWSTLRSCTPYIVVPACGEYGATQVSETWRRRNNAKTERNSLSKSHCACHPLTSPVSQGGPAVTAVHVDSRGRTSGVPLHFPSMMLTAALSWKPQEKEEILAVAGEKRLLRSRDPELTLIPGAGKAPPAPRPGARSASPPVRFTVDPVDLRIPLRLFPQLQDVQLKRTLSTGRDSHVTLHVAVFPAHLCPNSPHL